MSWNNLERARQIVEAARSVCCLTGAGISAASGVPTFQSGARSLNTEERRTIIAAAEPNPAHRALVELAKFKPVTIVTQNVDSLHQRAGSKHVIELHGNFQSGTMVKFGERIPKATIEAALEALKAKVLLVVGTSLQVMPAAEFPAIAKEHGSLVIEINTQPTPFSKYAYISLEGPAEEVLPLLIMRLEKVCA